MTISVIIPAMNEAENLPLIREEACAVVGAKPQDGNPLLPSGFWVLHIGWNALVCAERHHAAPR